MFVLRKLTRIAAVAVAAAGVVFPATSVAAAKTICVGVIVDAQSLDGPVSVDCSKVPDGSTGYDVLRAAGHTVGFRQDGLICTIDNRPADGCAATDALHYWAYFHREPHSSSWSYSNEGATTYEPDNGETEGWVWRNGDEAKPKNVPYSTVCPQTASPSPRAIAQPRSAAPTPGRSPIGRPVATAGTPSGTGAAPSPSTGAHQRQRPRRPVHPTVTPTAVTTTDAPTTVAALTSQRHNRSSEPPWGLIVGAVAVVALGGAAALRWRRRGAE